MPTAPNSTMLRLTTPSTLFLAASALLFASCSGGSKGAARSGSLTLSATTSEPTTGPIVIANGSAQVEIDAAHLHVGNLEIEMHGGGRRGASGAHGNGSHPVENEGQGGSGGENENEGESGGGSGNSGNEVVDDIRLAGPYTFDLTAGPTVIESVPVVPGTFDRVDLRFVVATEAPFDGSSIVIRGVYIGDSGSVPFTLRTDFDGSTHVPIANGGITVTANSVVPVEIAFDLTALFGSLDFAHATVDGGEILIDGTHNQAVLLAFETALHGCVDGHEHGR